ncbi:MAG: hypothetical protein JOZ41_20500, partial [Chloroflexi bacterium]|nr:hypothetical protein [Chloroflexota bacterium]
MNTCGTSNQGEDGREDLTQGDSRAPTRLRAEHLDHALGIGDRTPRLSWQLSDGTARQLAYRLRIDSGGDTEWVESDRSVLVPWPFEPLRSLQRLTWRVQVRTDRGESRWSEPASIEAGLLDAADWTAIWVRPAEEVIPPPGQRPAYELR